MQRKKIWLKDTPYLNTILKPWTRERMRNGTWLGSAPIRNSWIMIQSYKTRCVKFWFVGISRDVKKKYTNFLSGVSQYMRSNVITWKLSRKTLQRLSWKRVIAKAMTIVAFEIQLASRVSCTFTCEQIAINMKQMCLINFTPNPVMQCVINNKHFYT